MSQRGKSVFVCFMLAIAGVCFQVWRSAAVQSAPAAALSGEAALQQLKTNGGYASLAAAMTAARYQINATPTKPGNSGAPFYANNPSQQLRASFAPAEVRVNAAPNKTDAKTGAAELRLQLAGYGYGDQFEPLAAGKLTVNGDRITIRKSAIRNPQSAIEEWYVNKPEGLEQGFTLAAPPQSAIRNPQSAIPLRVTLSIGAPGSGWRVSLRGDGQGALFERQADGLRLGYDHLAAYDSQGRTLPARMALAGGTLAQLMLLVDDAQAVYPLTIDPIITQQRKLTAADGAAEDLFGRAVALSGDTAVIGAPRDNVTGDDQGSAYVFTRSGAVWTLQQKLTADDGAADDDFGRSVALSIDTVVVGADSDTIGANAGQGSAYVFTRGGAVWTQQQKLTANDGAAGDHFGVSVAISGDTVVVGANLADIFPNVDQGAAYVFTRSGAVWTPQQKLTANDGAANDFFGVSVTLSGDTVVVGAYFDDSGANTDQGSAYVFTRGFTSSGAVWTLQQKLTAADGAARDQFGCSVAISGDTVVVGAYLDDIGYTNQGSAYVFTRGLTPSGAVWTQQQRLTANDGAADDQFGVSVALSGDTLVVGAWFDDIGAFANQGSAYVFSRADSMVWRQQRKLTADDGAAFDQFGFSVALSGDTVVVGAVGDDTGANSNQGSAYAFVIRANDLVQQQPLTAADGAALDAFGNAVAVSGDTAVVGAPFDSIGANGAQGSAYIFTRGFTPSGAVWTLQQKLTASDGAADDRFGKSVALSGDTVVVGAYLDDIGGNTDQGSAYVFTRSGTVWTQQQRLTANDGASIDQFGFSVALSGDTVVAGANRDNIISPIDQGSAYVFTRSGTVWTQQQRLSASDGADEDNFGVSVSLSGDTMVVGAYGDDNGANVDQGSAYVFTRGFTPSGAVWTQQQRLTANDGAANDSFGFSVALSGDTVVVGAFLNDTGAIANQGAAYVFTRVGTLWLQQQRLVANDGVANDHFGFSVTISGDTAVVGAEGDDTGANFDQGSAYVFTRSANAWTQQQKFTANDGAAADGFGNAVALSGDTVLVGASTDDIGANQAQGSAYVFVWPACPALALNPASMPNGVLNTAYSQTVTVGGGAGPYQFSLSDGALPPGLSLPQTGLLSGAPTTAGTYRFTITAAILSSLCPGSRSYTLTVTGACPAITFNPASLPAGVAGQQYNQTLTATGGAAPFNFTISAGALPNGMTLSAAGLLSGAPTAFGAFNFTVRATDANGCQGTRAYLLTITAPCPTIIINPALLPSGTMGAAYSQTITATGGASPYTFTVSAGNLPTGLSLSANGALSGAPLAAGSFNFTLRATDPNGCQGARAYTLTINPNGGGGQAGLQYYPLPRPIRLLDTRPGESACNAPGLPLANQATLNLIARGNCDGVTIPANAQAVVGNATVVNFISGGGFITLYPSDTQQPNASNLNFTANHITPNSFTVGLGADGGFKIYSHAATHFIVDITGYYAPPGQGGLYYHPLPAPVRLFDSRPGETACDAPGAPLANDGVRSVLAQRSCLGATIPQSAKAIVGNATVVNFISSGFRFITLYPSGVAQPNASNLNFTANQIVPNSFVVGLSDEGRFDIYSHGATHFIVDVNGYYSDQAVDANGEGLLYHPLSSPARLLDTRPGQIACEAPGVALDDDGTLTLSAHRTCASVTIPATAKAVVGNATVVNFISSGFRFITLYPFGVVQPNASNLNFTANQIVPNSFVVGLSDDGKFSIYSHGSTHFIVDLTGYFAP